MSDTSASFVELRASPTTGKYTNDDRYRHCEEWQSSGLSMSEYCRQSGIAVSSLSKWIKENKKIKGKLKPSSGNTIQVKQMVEIILVSGVRLRFSISSIPEILRIVRALESCT